MSTFRNPVGPQPPKVYWRRRLIVGLGALAVIVFLIVFRPGSGATAPKSDATGVKSTSAASPSPSAPAAAAGAACVPAKLKLVAVTDKTIYGAGEQPQISMSITNTGQADCTMNLGSTQQELIITSGSEQIWDSKDCQSAPVDAPSTLKPNVAITTPPIPWDRTRSAASTCQKTRPPVTAAGASYHLSVKMGPLASKQTVQFILN
ncbi:hypothetical protein [Lacisediminihabitans sp.]|uniref:hypothetical protein n=1 Tax=Lacisediminihabitans sp. TaxID=2787631 RepID=UPI00374CEA04